jgi:hypothetical protein
MGQAKQLFDYLATNPNATIWFHASDTIMNVHSDASYLSKASARSHEGSHFFHGMVSKRRQSNQIK